MVHWHITVFIMFVYYTSMKRVCDKRKKKKFKEEEFLSLLIVNYIIPLLLYDYMIKPNTVSNDQHIRFYVPLPLRFTL